MTATVIAPSLLAADAGEWGQEIKLIDDEGVRCLHLDIMDGRFVPNLTFGAGPVGMLRKYSDMEFDAHLMVSEPESMIQDMRKAGVNSITAHHEACAHLMRVLQMIREQGMKAGVAINPATPAEILSPVLPFVDRVLVMTVNPGFGGQAFIPAVLPKIKAVKRMVDAAGLDTEIQVDGGINLETAAAVVNAGANVLVAGAAVFGAADIAVAVLQLRDAAENR